MFVWRLNNPFNNARRALPLTTVELEAALVEHAEHLVESTSPVALRAAAAAATAAASTLQARAMIIEGERKALACALREKQLRTTAGYVWALDELRRKVANSFPNHSCRRTPVTTSPPAWHQHSPMPPISSSAPLPTSCRVDRSEGWSIRSSLRTT